MVSLSVPRRPPWEPGACAQLQIRGLLQALPLAWALGLPPPPHEDCAPASGPVQPSKGLGGARLAPEASILKPSPACRGEGRRGRLVQEGWHLFSAHRPQGVACEGKLQDQQVGASCCPPGPSGPHSGQGRPMASAQGTSHRMSFPEPGSVTESEPGEGRVRGPQGHKPSQP